MDYNFPVIKMKEKERFDLMTLLQRFLIYMNLFLLANEPFTIYV